MDGSFTVARTDQMRATVRRIVLAAAFLLISFPTWGQSPPATTPFVGNWEGVVAANNQNNTVRMTIAPFSNGFAVKVLHFTDGRWQTSPLAELVFEGSTFSIKFPSGNSYDGMHMEGDTLRGFFYVKSPSQTVPVQFTRQR
jgi:hypothetical protein